MLVLSELDMAAVDPKQPVGFLNLNEFFSMKRLESRIVTFYAYNFAAMNVDGFFLRIMRNETRRKEALESRSKEVAQFVALFSVLPAIIVIAMSSLSFISPEYSSILIVFAIVALVFGLTTKMDRIYDKNKSLIRDLTFDFRNTPGQGAWWARRRIFGIVLCQAAISAALFFLLLV